MWLFTKYGFYSATVSAQDKTKIQIRARAREDLEALRGFVGAAFESQLEVSDVIETPHADYRFRVLVDRESWPRIAWAIAEDVDYGNFKNQIADNFRHDLYARVWGVMLGLQKRQGKIENDAWAQDDFWNMSTQDDATWDDIRNQEEKDLFWSIANGEDILDGDDWIPEAPGQDDEDNDPSSPFYAPAGVL